MNDGGRVSKDVEISLDEASAEAELGAEEDERLVLPDGSVVDLKAEQQARIDRLYEAMEDADYYQLLEVNREATGKAIKRAYYRLSREFHPDRFYRRELGPYKSKLEQVFAKLNEAYRVLSDSKLRADYDSALAGAMSEGLGQVSMATHEVDFAALRRKKGTPNQAKQTKRKRPLPDHLVKAREEITERLKDARKAFLRGKRHFDLGEFTEASSQLQRSLLLDPKNKDARRLYDSAQDRSRNQKAELLWREGQDALKRQDPEAAAAKFKEAVECNPTKGKYYLSFGKVIWEHTMRHRTAIELIRTAVRKEPNRVDYLMELAQAYESVGMPNNALKALERGARIAPDDLEVKKALRRLR